MRQAWHLCLRFCIVNSVSAQRYRPAPKKRLSHRAPPRRQRFSFTAEMEMCWNAPCLLSAPLEWAL